MLRIKSSLVFRVPVMLPLFCFYSFDSSIHLLFYSLSSICPPFCPTSPHFHWLFLFLIEAASRRRTVYEDPSKSSRSSGNYDASTIPARSTGQTWPRREHQIYRSATCSYRVRLISEPNAVSLESTAPLTFPASSLRATNGWRVARVEHFCEKYAAFMDHFIEWPHAYAL